MKIVKLNGRFKQYRENRHTVALRFTTYGNDSRIYEQVCKAKLGGSNWNPAHDWYSYFGARNSRLDRDAGRPFWITFRNEADLTLVLLSVDLTN